MDASIAFEINSIDVDRCAEAMEASIAIEPTTVKSRNNDTGEKRGGGGGDLRVRKASSSPYAMT